MYWNYRILHDGTDYYIGEVYYDADDNPHSYVGGSDEYQAIVPHHHLASLLNEIDHVTRAGTRPVIHIHKGRITGEG